MAEWEQLLADFVGWARKHITGDEKGQAQIFLDRLFQAFGHPGSLDVGGSPEMRIRKAKEDGGGTSFADYVWKPLVLIQITWDFAPSTCIKDPPKFAKPSWQTRTRCSAAKVGNAVTLDGRKTRSAHGM